MLSTRLGQRSVVGAIQVVNRMQSGSESSKQPFTLEEEKLLGEFADQIAGAVARCQQSSLAAKKQMSIRDKMERLEAACAASDVLGEIVCTTCDLLLRSGKSNGPTKHECLLSVCSSIKRIVGDVEVVRVYFVNPETHALEFVVCDKPQNIRLGPPSSIIDMGSNTIVAGCAHQLKLVHYDTSPGVQSYTVETGGMSNTWQQNQQNGIACAVALPIVQTIANVSMTTASFGSSLGGTGSADGGGRRNVETEAKNRAPPSLVGVVELICLNNTDSLNMQQLDAVNSYLKMTCACLRDVTYSKNDNKNGGTRSRSSSFKTMFGADHGSGENDGERKGSNRGDQFVEELPSQSLANALDFAPLLLREKSAKTVQKKLAEAHELLFGAESVCLWTLQSKGKLVPFGSSSGHQRHHHRKKHVHRHHHHNSQDWMQADVGPAGHCLSTGDIVNLTTASGTYGSNCGVNIVSVNSIVVNSVLCCPVEVQGRRVGVLQVLNKLSGSFDLASDVQTVQLCAILIAEWIDRWDIRHQLQTLELACATMRSSGRKKVKQMRQHLKDMGKSMSQQLTNAQHDWEHQKQGWQHQKQHWQSEKRNWHTQRHNWEENVKHAKELEQLHRLDHLLRHGEMSRAMRKLQRHCWHMSQDEVQRRKALQITGMSRIRTAFQNILGLHSMRRYGQRWGFEMLRRNLVPLKLREMIEVQQEDLAKKREKMRVHALRIRQATMALKRLSMADV